MRDVDILIEVSLWTLLSLVYVYAIVSRLPRNLPRLIASAPVFYLFFTLPRRFSVVNFVAISSFYLSWLGNFRICLLCFDRGPLVPLPGSLLSFLAFAALPIKPRSTPAAASKAVETHQGSVGKALLRASLCFFLSALIVKLAVGDRVPRHGISLPVLYTFLLLVFMEALFAASSVPGRLVPGGVELEPQFDRPYLSESLADFWGRRWNLMVTNVLRPSVYLPVKSACSGVLGPRPARLVGILATFVVSGIMHELILWYESSVPATWEWLSFFALHGLLTAFEAWLSWVLPPRASWLPRPLKVVLTLSVLYSTALWLFFPPVMRSGLDVKFLREISDFIDMFDAFSLWSGNSSSA